MSGSLMSVNTSNREGYAPYANDTFTVGWICALACELEAATIMLDEIYGRPRYQDRRLDDNHYRLGRLRDHNVVLTVLGAGQTGTTAASIVATQMKSTFRNIKYGLLVGIGGGVPPPGDCKSDSVRLGDVVVGIPRDTHGGVMQYDFGKEESMGFEFKKHLNATPPSITKVLSAIMRSRKAKHLLDEVILPKLQHDHPDAKADFQYPGDEADMLFEFDCGKHPNRETERCFKCNNEPLIFKRPKRVNGSNPVVFYGTIASGDSVIKNAVKRDRIRGNSRGAYCVEMEAAGLMNCFPCVVIRGICDYADSTKDDKWQNYAAITAAAYAKVLLEECYPEPPLREIWDSIPDHPTEGQRSAALRSITSSILQTQSNSSSNISVLSRTSTAPSKLSNYKEVESLPPDARLLERKRQGHLVPDASKYRVPSFALSENFGKLEKPVDQPPHGSTSPLQDFSISIDKENQQPSDTFLKSRDPNKLSSCNNDQYRVAWLCMVASEYDSALVMLDEVHGRPSLRSEGDVNQYTLGRIKRHNVVVAPLAALPILKMVKCLMSTFPKVEVLLVVGVSEGFPNPASIRIGDVVVGFPIPEPDDEGEVASVWNYVVENENEPPDHRQLKISTPANVTRAVAALRVDLQDREFLREKIIKPQLSKPFVDEETWKESQYPERNNEISSGIDSEPSVHYGRLSRGKPHIIEVLPYDRDRPDHLFLPNLCMALKSNDLVIYGYPLLMIKGVGSYTSTDGPLGTGNGNDAYASIVAASYARALLLEMRSKWPDRSSTFKASDNGKHLAETGTSKSSWTEVSSKPFSVVSKATQGSSRAGFQLVDHEPSTMLQTVSEESVSSSSGFIQGILGVGKGLFGKRRR